MELFNEINNKESNQGKIIELRDLNVLLNDFEQVKENCSLNEEIKRKIEDLDKHKKENYETNKETIQCDEDTNLKKKRRRKQFEEESLITPWVDTTVQLYNTEFQYFNDNTELKDKNDNPDRKLDNDVLIRYDMPEKSF